MSEPAAPKRGGDPDPDILRDRIRAKALELGFAEARFGRAEAAPQLARDLAEYLAQGRHGDMGWMEANSDRRADPRILWPEARGVVVLGENYGPGDDPLAIMTRRDRGAISVYARGRDYHHVLKKRLRVLATWLARETGGAVKLFVDTAPVMEKPLAQSAGMGWQGRHTNLVSRRFGSWLFLGEIFTEVELPADPPGRDLCGSCRACEAACPTGALADGHIDPRLCISYLTIEHQGHIPAALRPAFGNRIYGCDDCLAVCPWNKFAAPTQEPEYRPRPELIAPRLDDLAALDDAAFRMFFSGSPIKRVGQARFLRNVLIAIGNSGDPELGRVAATRLGDPSPLVRAMAAWAVRRLLPENEVARLAAEHLPGEKDEAVRKEWGDAIEPANG